MFTTDQPQGDDPLMGPVDLDWARNCLRGMSSQTFFERYTSPALILSLREGVSPFEDSREQMLSTRRSSLSADPTRQVGVTIIAPKARRRRGPRPRVTLGRSSEVDITIKIATLSKLHAWFARSEDDTWVVADAGSTNGTWARDKRLETSKPQTVSSGDSLLFGPDVAALFLEPRDLIHYLLLK